MEIYNTIKAFVYQRWAGLCISVLLGFACYACAAPFTQDVFESLHSASIFSVGVLTIPIGLISLFNVRNIRFTLVDLVITFVLLIVILLVSFNDYWALGYMACLTLYWAIRTGKYLSYDVIFVFIAITVMSLAYIGYLQYFDIEDSNHPILNISGPYFNPGVYGSICGMLCVPCLAVIVKANPKDWKLYISLVCLLVITPIIKLSGSRTAWLAMIVALVFICYQKWIKDRFTNKAKVVIFSLLTVLLIGGVCWLYSIKKDSADGRLLIWKVSVEMIKQKPITGYGKGGFEANYMLFQHDYLKEKGTETDKYVAGNNRLTFNEPLRLWVEYGIAGILLYLLLVYLIIRLRTPDRVAVAAKAVLLYFIVAGLTHYPAQFFPTMFCAIVALAVLVSRQPNMAGYTFSWRIAMPVLILLVAGSAFVYYHSYSAYNALNKILNDRTIQPENKLAGLYELDCKMSHNTSFNILYTSMLRRHDGDTIQLEKKLNDWDSSYPNSELYLLRGELAENRQQYELAERYYWTAHHMVPNRQRPRGAIALMYMRTGREEQARIMAEEIINEQVKVYGFGTYELHQKLKTEILKEY